MLAGESGSGKYLVGRVHVHVILLGVHREIFETRGYGIVVIRDLDRVVDDVAGMGDPLSPDHELVVDAVAKGVGHATVPAREPDTALDGSCQALYLLLCDSTHRPDRDYQKGASTGPDKNRRERCRARG